MRHSIVSELAPKLECGFRNKTKPKYNMTTIKFAKATLSLLIATALGFSAAVAADESSAALKAQAKITQEDAAKTALAKVPGGKIKSAELEKEHGKLVWSFDISMPKSKNITEVQVDAKTGKVVSVEVETPEQQAKEAAADKLEKKK